MTLIKDIKLVFSCNVRPVRQLSSEVVVGAQCGSAVLRGAHVFAPGIVASPKCNSHFIKINKNTYFYSFLSL